MAPREERSSQGVIFATGRRITVSRGECHSPMRMLATVRCSIDRCS